MYLTKYHLRSQVGCFGDMVRTAGPIWWARPSPCSVDTTSAATGHSESDGKRQQWAADEA